jgi:hypothetical protein
MIFTGAVARDLVIAVIGAVLLNLAVNGLSKLDTKFAGTTTSSQEIPSVVTDDCGAAVEHRNPDAGDCRAAFLFHVTGVR